MDNHLLASKHTGDHPSMGDESKAQGAASADSPAATATGKDVGLLGDAFIRFQRQGRPSIINALMTLERSPKRGAIEAVLTKLGTEYPVFRSYPRKPCSGGMKWVTVDMADFRVEDHLVRHEIALGGPTPEGQAGTMDAAVSQYVSTRLTDPVPMQEGGMWEVHMVTFTGAGATERCDVVWRISHSCGDGMMLSTVLVGLCEAIDPAKPKKPRTKRPKQKVNCCSMLCTAISAWNKVRVGGGGGVWWWWWCVCVCAVRCRALEILHLRVHSIAHLPSIQHVYCSHTKCASNLTCC
jgi:hypothetical protein